MNFVNTYKKVSLVKYGFIFFGLSFSGCTLSFERDQQKVVTTPEEKKQILKYIYLTFDDGPLNGSENIDSVTLAEN